MLAITIVIITSLKINSDDMTPLKGKEFMKESEKQKPESWRKLGNIMSHRPKERRKEHFKMKK